MQKRAANVFLAGGTLIGFLGSVVRVAFEILGGVQTVLWLRTLTEAGTVPDFAINWTAINFYLLVFCTSGLIAVNWGSLRRWWVSQLNKKSREWNMAGSDAINYIARGSRLSETLDYDRAHEDAIEVFMSYAKAGRILVAGRPKADGLLTLIGPRTWKRERLFYRMKGGDRYEREVAETSIVSVTDSKSVLFRGLMVDRHEVARLWPPKPSRF